MSLLNGDQGAKRSEECVWTLCVSSLNQCWEGAEVPKKRQRWGSWLGGGSDINSKCPDSIVKARRWRRQRLWDAFWMSERTEGRRTFSSFGKLLLASSYVSIYRYLCYRLDDLKDLIQHKWFYIYAVDCSEALTDPALTPRWIAKSHLSTAWCQTLVWLQWAIFLSIYVAWCIWDNMETSWTWDI